MSDLPFATRFWRLFMRMYPAVRNSRVPWTPLSKPLTEARVALVTTCGVYLATDAPFDAALDHHGGDASFREIPGDVLPTQLAIRHGHYDEKAAQEDMNCIFPLWRLQALANEGLIGSVAPRHFGFRGAISKTQPLITRFAPDVAARLKADAVDIVLLTPC
jgi:D-proline reductase (dithiol) PrdB